MTLSYCDIFSINKIFSENRKLQNEFNEFYGNYDSKKTSSRAFLLLNLKAHGVHLNILNTIQYNQFGKPYFDAGNIRFNLSHCREILVCVISFNSDIGVDVEFHEKNFNEKDFESVFTSQEIDSIENSKSLYKLWTRKESLIKALGLNLDINLKEICTLQDTLTYQNRTWYFENINAIPYYEISVCNSINEKCKIIEINDILFNNTVNLLDQDS